MNSLLFHTEITVTPVLLTLPRLLTDDEATILHAIVKVNGDVALAIHDPDPDDDNLLADTPANLADQLTGPRFIFWICSEGEWSEVLKIAAMPDDEASRSKVYRLIHGIAAIPVVARPDLPGVHQELVTAFIVDHPLTVKYGAAPNFLLFVLRLDLFEALHPAPWLTAARSLKTAPCDP